MDDTIQVQITTIRFPDLQFFPRDAHKLRGYFGTLFKKHSPLLHNHFEDGKLRYRYPLVQYKVCGSIPMLVGINEGGNLLSRLFLEIKEINLENKVYPVLSKNICLTNSKAGITDTMQKYEFKTLWMALNRENYNLYSCAGKEERQKLLSQILTGNILSMFKGINCHLEKKVMVYPEMKEKVTSFKNQRMLAFDGWFASNALLPSYTGIGKAVSRGFGTIYNLTIN